MKTLLVKCLLGILWLLASSPVRASCISLLQDASNPDLIRLTIEAPRNYSVSQLGLANHLAFLSVLDVVPEKVTLLLNRSQLESGAFKLEPFVEAIRKISSNLVVNFMLRLGAHWAQLIASENRHPELAGELFASWFNYEAIAYNEDPELRIRAMSFLLESILPTGYVANLGQLTDTYTLRLIFSHLRRVNGELELSKPAEDVLPEALARMADFYRGVLVPSDFTQRGFHRAESILRDRRRRPVHSIHLETQYFWKGASHLGCSALGEGRLPGHDLLKWRNKVYIDGKLSVGYFALSKALGDRFVQDLHLIDLALFPFFKQNDFYDSRVGEVAPNSAVLLAGEDLREAAYAAMLENNYAHYPPGEKVSDSARRYTHLLLVERDVTGTVGFAFLERIALKFSLPVVFLSRPWTGNEREFLKWSAGRSYQGRAYRPTRALSGALVPVGGDADRIRRIALEELGLSSEENLRLLDQQTGIITFADSRKN